MKDHEWFMHQCCAPIEGRGPQDICEECSKPQIVCATMETVRHILNEKGDGDQTLEVCGWNGFWCHGCGKFWGVDTCGNDHRDHKHKEMPVVSGVVGEGYSCQCDCGKVIEIA